MEDLKMIDRLEERRFKRRLWAIGAVALAISIPVIIVAETIMPTQIERCSSACAKNGMTFSWSSSAKTPPGQANVPERCDCRPITSEPEKKAEASTPTPWGGTLMMRSDENGNRIYMTAP